MRLLLTGFEPFGGREVNASEQVVGALRDYRFPGVDLHTAILPVDRQRGPDTLLQALRDLQPDAVICLGEARGRMSISIERVAINLLDYAIADNTGARVVDQPVVPDGPAAYFTTLPVRALWETLRAAGIPVELSLSAGAFLCNQVAYVLLHHLSRQRHPCLAGFIHLPWLPQQAAREATPVATMSLATMSQALDLVINTLASHSFSQER